MKLVIVKGKGHIESSVAYLVEHQAYNLSRPGFKSCQSFGQWLKFLTNLTNLTNLLSRNLGKTQILTNKLFPHR